MLYDTGEDCNNEKKISSKQPCNGKIQYINGILIIKKNFILASLVRYLLKNIAVATHISKKEDREIASKIIDDNSVTGKPGWFVTQAVIGSGIISDIEEAEKQESRYNNDSRRFTETSENDNIYSIIPRFLFEVSQFANKKTRQARNMKPQIWLS